MLHTAAGDVVEQAPVAYQMIDGVRQAVSVRYVLEGNGQVGFAVGSYDPSQALVIDPVLSYSTLIGGSDFDEGYGIALDTSGNIYITGATYSSSFPGTNQTNAGNNDAFVSELVSAAVVTDVTTTLASNSTLGTGKTVTIDVDFIEAVDVNTTGGTPTLALNDSAGSLAHYSGGSGTSTLQFSFSVPAGDTAAPLDSTGTDALALNGGTITDDPSDGDSNAATLTLPSPAGSGDDLYADNITIDATTPTVTSVSTTTAAGTYGPNATVNIDVNFSENVQVTDTPTLTLNDGQTASYSSGSGTSTLVFTYTVAKGDTTNGANLDYASATALSGTIHNAGGVAATRTLPIPGSDSDTFGTTGILIDATTPTVARVASTLPKPNGDEKKFQEPFPIRKGS